MELTIDTFRTINWVGNPFEVTERDSLCISFAVHDLAIGEQQASAAHFVFVEPRHEWAMLWDEKSEKWINHPDTTTPIGPMIVEAFVKRGGGALMLSFGGDHKLGWSRWGFSVPRMELTLQVSR